MSTYIIPVSISSHLHKLIDVSVAKNSFGNPVLSCHVLTTREIRGYRKMVSIMLVYRMQFLTLCSTSVDQIILSIDKCSTIMCDSCRFSYQGSIGKRIHDINKLADSWVAFSF